MTNHVLYVESSALVKLVIPEAESDALRAVLSAWAGRATSVLAKVEVPRAVRRYSTAPTVLERAVAVVEDSDEVPLEPDVLRVAAVLLPVTVRSLDAIHLASALSLGADLDGIVTYDDRLAEAARMAGVSVLQPR